jgi:hypothetical protein
MRIAFILESGEIDSTMNPKEASISSRQMYQIENNGSSLLGMHKSYMMENAGHGLADFIISKMGILCQGRALFRYVEQETMAATQLLHPDILQGTTVQRLQ